jgi:hypothetical protein
MKKTLLAITAASALCVGVPANAQVGDIIAGIFGGGGYESRLRELEQRIEYGAQRGRISRGEADRLWASLQDLRVRESQYDDRGFTREERYDLDQRIADLDRRITDAERGGNDGGWDGGNDDRFGYEVRELRDRIEQGARNGRLTRDVARALRAQLIDINRREQRYDNDGLSRWERDDLRNRIQRLRRNLQNALRDRDYREEDREDYRDRDRERDRYDNDDDDDDD